jgi:hypothetical protein
MTMSNTGHCLCGAVVYAGKGERGQIRVCHCAECVRWTGSPFMGLKFSGGIDIANPGAVNWFKSSEWAERGSCRVCGTTLFWRSLGNHADIIVTAGSLDDKAGVGEIEEHIFIDSKPHYYDFAGDAPRVTGAEVFARFQNSQGEP